MKREREINKRKFKKEKKLSPCGKVRGKLLKNN